MAKTAAKTRSRSKKKSKKGADAGNIAKVPIELKGWYLRTLNLDTSGEYNKLRRAMEFFLVQAEQKLNTQLWDRATDVALEEALRHLVYRWGPKFQNPLHLEIRVTDTHLQFSLTVPTDAVVRNRKELIGKARLTAESGAEKSLYVVRCLMDRLRKDPAGRQLVFRRLMRPLPPF